MSALYQHQVGTCGASIICVFSRVCVRNVYRPGDCFLCDMETLAYDLHNIPTPTQRSDQNSYWGNSDVGSKKKLGGGALIDKADRSGGILV